MRDRESHPPDDETQFDVEPLPEVPQAHPPINWWTLAVDERAETLHTLAGWVPEFVRRYAIVDQIVPPCWYRHEALIQELLGIYQAREHSAFDPYAAPTAPNDFHYQLELFRHRVRGLVAQFGCNVAEHFETAVPQWAVADTRADVWRKEVADFIDENSRVRWPGWDVTVHDREDDSHDN